MKTKIVELLQVGQLVIYDAGPDHRVVDAVFCMMPDGGKKAKVIIEERTPSVYHPERVAAQEVPFFSDEPGIIVLG